MAIQSELAVNKYLLPGTYIGEAYNPAPVNTGLFPRIPCYIGKGLPYLLANNMPIIRSFVYGERCVFPTTGPFVYNLLHNSNGNQSTVYSQAAIRLYNTDDVEVPTRFWKFIQLVPDGPYDAVQIFGEVFNPNDTYYIDYQSTDTTIYDPLPVSGIIQVNTIGDHVDEALYLNHTDWESYTTLAIAGPTGAYLLGGPTAEPIVAPVGEITPITKVKGRPRKVTLSPPEGPVGNPLGDFGPLGATGTTGGSILINNTSNYEGPDRHYYLTVEGNTEVAYPTFSIDDTSVAVITISSDMYLPGGDTTYVGLNPETYTLTVANLVVSTTTTFDLNWVGIAGGGTSGVIHVSTTQTSIAGLELMDGVIVDLAGVDNLQNADTFTIDIVETAHVEVSWYSDDYQSSSGIFSFLSNTTALAQVLEAGIILDFYDLASFVVGNTWEITAENTDSINWNFSREIDQDFTPSDIYYDAMGLVTGTPRTYYITLNHIPIEQILPIPTVVVTRIDTSAVIPSTNIPGTPYVKLTITSPLLVNFRANYHYSNSPQAGQQYYVTAKYTRPESMYNSISIYSDYKTALGERGYASTDNHLGIMLDYAFNVAKNRYVAVVQVYDSDHDGIYNLADFRTALQSTYKDKNITDIIVLSKFDTLADQMYQSQMNNDPLVGALRLYWIGYPVNYPVGMAGVSGTIADTSLNVLQVSGDNAAHGTFISCANTWVKRTITLQSGATVQLTLDGSFFAGMLAAINDAFLDPNTLLNSQVIPGIDSIQTYDTTTQETLGSTSNTFAALPANSTVPKVVDAVTTDTVAADYHEINVMCVKQLVTKRVIQTCNTACIGYVPRDVDDGITFVRSTIARELTSCISDTLIADYSDSSGRPRDLQPATDINVWRSGTDKTRYNFTYWFNGRYGIKRLTGLYSVDSNIFNPTA
jgi:hypothetical protein